MDWLRFVNVELHTTDIIRLISVVERLHRPALREFLENVHPAHGLPLEELSVNGLLKDPITRYLSLLWSVLRVLCIDSPDFTFLLAQTNGHSMSKPSVRSILLESLFSGFVTIIDIRRAVRVLDHTLKFSKTSGFLQENVLLLLAQIIARAKSVLSPETVVSLKKEVFLYSMVHKLCIDRALSKICYKGPSIQALESEKWFDGTTGLSELVDNSLDPSDPVDNEIVRPICNIWKVRLEQELDELEESQLEVSCEAQLLP